MRSELHGSQNGSRETVHTFSLLCQAALLSKIHTFWGGVRGCAWENMLPGVPGVAFANLVAFIEYQKASRSAN